MKRLFIATFIDISLFEFLYKEIQEDFNKVCIGKWVELKNLHFTYKFLGDVEEDKIPEIKESLKHYLTDYNSTLEINGLGVFPNKNRPKVLFAKVFNPQKTIFRIQKGIEQKLENLGFERERRKFTPHLTLCRLKSRDKKFDNILSYYYDFNIGDLSKLSVELYQSKLSHKGPIYKKV